MDVSSIADMSVGMSQTQLMTDIGVAVLSMSLDAIDSFGSGMIDMMERSMMEKSVNPSVGANIDVMV